MNAFVKRVLLAISVMVLCAAAAGADEFSVFDRVAIKPTTANYLIASVHMDMPPFTRKRTVFSSTYAASVTPFFFYNESGRIWINLKDEGLRKVAKGEPTDFTGQAVSESGGLRRVEGRATPTGPRSGKIRVRVFVSRRIALTYDTTYELTGPAVTSK